MTFEQLTDEDRAEVLRNAANATSTLCGNGPNNPRLAALMRRAFIGSVETTTLKDHVFALRTLLAHLERGEITRRAFHAGITVSLCRAVPQHGNTYFVQCGGERGPVKIGVSIDTKERLATLQTSNPRKLVLLGEIENGGNLLELSLHAMFAKDRIQGEWFEWSEDVSRCVRELLGLFAVPARSGN